VQVVGIGLTGRVFKNTGPIGTLVKCLRRMGWAYTWFGIQTADLAALRLRMSRKPTVLRNPAFPVRVLRDVNDANTIQWLNDLQPDYIASLYFNQWIGAAVRAAARKDCVNCHPSLLPAFRGPDPVFRLLARGLTETGLTIHRVADDIDAGEILYQEPFSVSRTESVCGVYCKAVALGAARLGDFMSGRLPPMRERIPPVTADPSDLEYRTFPTPAEVAEFVKSGKRFLVPGELRRELASVP
jgi:hypothetical protein